MKFDEQGFRHLVDETIATIIRLFLDSLVTGECIGSSSANHEKQNR